MKITDLLPAIPDDERAYVDLVVNRLLHEIGFLGLPVAINRLLPMLKRPTKTRAQFADELQYNLFLLDRRYAPLKIIHEIIGERSGEERADTVVGELLVDISVEYAKNSYPKVTSPADFARFAQAILAEKQQDRFMQAEITVVEGASVDFKVTRCLYIEALQAVGLGGLAHRLCDPYRKYCDQYQPLLEVYEDSAIGRGDRDCRFGYRLRQK
jgi:hypothetical protein